MNEIKNISLQNASPSIVYKNNRLNEAHFEDFGYNDYRVLLHLLSKVGRINKEGKYTQSNAIQREHLLTAQEFSCVFKADLNNSYRFLQDSCNKLMKSRITLKSLDKKTIIAINVCSKAEYEESKGRIFIRFTEEIMSYLVYIKKDFVIFNLKEIQNFRSAYTIRLYELLKQFSTGWVKKSVEDLRSFLGVQVGQYLLYKHFKSRVILPACNEINMNYDMNVRFEEKKVRKKVSIVTFFFSKKKQKTIEGVF
ncbi:MAG: replication initiation protein [Rickettsia sp.]|nr:replication initiation protein [Rickettsia sp.]